MKTAQSFLDDANAVVAKLDAADAIEVHKAGKGLFIDVRDSSDIAKTGTIQGALRIPRGFVEFVADPATPVHNEALQKDAEIYLVCGLGGQAALAGKTLNEMGFTNVTNVGGIASWKKAGGAMEAA